MKLTKNRCRKCRSITVPYSNDSQNITDGWPVSCSADVSKINAKSLTLLLEVGGLATVQR